MLAHPRACGENRNFAIEVSLHQGSSPRVRGKRYFPFEEWPEQGLIPARAGKTVQVHGVSWPGPAHPRACGENLAAAASSRPRAGSSPRVRGKLAGYVLGGVGRGLIPARAGKTGHLARRRLPSRAHPRACGENGLGPVVAFLLPGSSPRVRGKQVVPVLQGDEGGLIPARAGKTRTTAAGARFTTAHPRACGENTSASRDSSVIVGSSPRVRGKRRSTMRTPTRRRLIPARAGKTRGGRGGRFVHEAHPRACGENAAGAITDAADAGSSPRVRGKRLLVLLLGFPLRLIPARAGKTPRTLRTPRSPSAHPRACGENDLRVAPQLVAEGSSPRVRGKPVRAGQGNPHRGLIPARAGKTQDPSSSSGPPQAHPRACGENSCGGVFRGSRVGSSPRVRGKQHADYDARIRERLIPARAGKTTLEQH